MDATNIFFVFIYYTVNYLDIFIVLEKIDLREFVYVIWKERMKYWRHNYYIWDTVLYYISILFISINK